MIGVDINTLPFYPKISNEHIKHLRQLRNCTQRQFAELMGIDHANLSRLEAGQMELSPLYYGRLLLAIKEAGITEFEIENIKMLVAYRKEKGL